MQLEDWTRLAGLTALSLRGAREEHHGTLIAVLPRMTRLRSLSLPDCQPPGLADEGRWPAPAQCTCLVFNVAQQRLVWLGSCCDDLMGLRAHDLAR